MKKDKIIYDVLVAKMYAIRAHENVNQKYDGNNYSVHLEHVFNYGIKYSKLINEKNQKHVYMALWLHDTIEDCNLTYNDIYEIFGFEVSEIVFALTNEKGKTRNDRANEKYYNDMKKVEFATFCKICDRLANVTYAKNKFKENKNNKMFPKYQKENVKFKLYLYNPKYKEMFDELDELLEN